MAAERFDASYYERFYRNPRTRVSDASHYAALGAFAAGYAALLQVEIRSVLDLGCGLGRWKSVVRRRFPKARYTGVEVSEHLCERLGWTRGSVVDYRARGADLVVCQGVLQYLPPRAAAQAIRNLSQLTRRLLYLEALTEEDWEAHCDRDRTDGDVYLRASSWYRTRLSRSFRSLGGGLFVPKDSDVLLYELEKPF